MTRRGALLAFGAHKGSGLAIMCEVLGGAVAGGATIAPHHPRKDGIVNSMLSFILDAAASATPHTSPNEVACDRRLGEGLTAGPGSCRRPPARRTRGTRTARRGRAEGVFIDEKSLADILAAALSLGLTQAELDRTLGR